jgi:hypothetical protein
MRYERQVVLEMQPGSATASTTALNPPAVATKPKPTDVKAPTHPALTIAKKPAATTPAHARSVLPGVAQ